MESTVIKLDLNQLMKMSRLVHITGRFVENGSSVRLHRQTRACPLVRPIPMSNMLIECLHPSKDIQKDNLVP